VLERLADFPRAAGLLAFALQIAPRHVQRDSVTPDAIHGAFDWDVDAAGPEGHEHLDLVVDVPGLVGIGEIRPIGEEIVGILLEEERRLPVRIATMVSVHVENAGLSGTFPANCHADRTMTADVTLRNNGWLSSAATPERSPERRRAAGSDGVGTSYSATRDDRVANGLTDALR